MAMTRKERELFQQTFDALKQAEAKVIEQSRQREAAEYELRRWRSMLRMMGQELGRVVFCTDVEVLGDRNFRFMMACSAGQEREDLMAQVMAGTIGSMFPSLHMGPVVDQHVADGDAEPEAEVTP